MKLDKHLASKFLRDDELVWKLVEMLFPQFKGVNLHTMEVEDFKKLCGSEQNFQQISDLYKTLEPLGQKAYYITTTVFDKLDMLKVTKNAQYKMRDDKTGGMTGDIVTTYDWSVFSNTSQVMAVGEKNNLRKFTFILPNNELIRMASSNGYIVLCYLSTNKIDWKVGLFDVQWSMSWVNIKDKAICKTWMQPEVQKCEELIYKLLCFLYLSDNEEQIVQPGHKYGSKKHDKLINSLAVPVTIVTSKWNITSIRTEGFDVSGHFRLQPTSNGHKMIFIQPFKKHGYVRRAKSETE